MINFTTTSHETDTHGVKVLAYSFAGMGKSVLCATAPKPLILSAESGLLSLSRQNLVRLFGENAPGATYDIPVIKIDSMQQLNESYDWISQNIASGHFDTICLDSISEIGELLIGKLKATYKDPRQAYGELIDQLSVTLRKFRDLPVNVYMSAKLDKVKDELTGAVTYNVAMPGSKVAQNLPYLFDEVFFLNVVTDQNGKQQRVLHTQPTFQFIAKDRSGVLDAMEAPHLSNIFNKIRGI